MSEPIYHVPVMLQEVLDGLMIKPNGVYVDGTFGGGGHSKALLSKLGADGKLIVFDQDAAAQRNVPDDKRIHFVPNNFRHLQRFLRLLKIQEVDGIMADLGVSSHQFDEADRGFSIRFDAALDMRMDRRQAVTAFDVVSTYSEQQLHKLFEQYGEVTNAKTLARTIVSVRNTASLQTIHQFKAALSGLVKGNPNKYYAQVFQALRIEVNDELGALKDLLLQSAKMMKPGGRLVILTFHSLEDRLVKQFIKKGQFEEPEEHPFETRKMEPPFFSVHKKPLVASAEEQRINGRSRSAKLRVAEKC